MSVELLCQIDTKMTLLSPESNAWVQSDIFSSNAYRRHASYVHSRHLESHGSIRKPTTVSVATGISIVQSAYDITPRRSVVGVL